MGSRWVFIVCLAAAGESPAGEPDWDRWIRDLASEDLATRERAAGAILEEGIRDPESAAARLSSAPVVDPEAVFRCRQIAQSLSFEAARRDVLCRAGDDPGLRLLLDDYLADPSPRTLWLIENVWGETHPDALPAAVGVLLRSPWPKTRARSGRRREARGGEPRSGPRAASRNGSGRAAPSDPGGARGAGGDRPREGAHHRSADAAGPHPS